MAFSHVRKTFRPIRRDLSKHTIDFIQQLQVLACKHPKRENFHTEIAKILELLEKYKNYIRTRLYYRATKQKKKTRAETTRDVKLLIEA